MKTLLILFVTIGSQILYSQEEKAAKSFFVEPLFRVYAIFPIALGNNYLAESNKEKTSVGFSMSVFEYHKFRAGIGFDHLFYEVTDVSKGATDERSKYSSFYGQLSYEIPFTKDFSIQPYVGFGYGELNFRKSSSWVDIQKGNQFRTGLYADYRIHIIISLFVSGTYVYAKFGIHTAPAYEAFFDHSTTVQLNFGIKASYSTRNKIKSQLIK